MPRPLFEDAPPDAEPSDTQLEVAETAIHTTLRSKEDEDAHPARRGKVRVIVRDADPISRAEEEALSRSYGGDDGEGRIWTLVGVIAALAAIAIGISFGLR